MFWIHSEPKPYVKPKPKTRLGLRSVQPRFQVLLSGLGRTIGTLISTYTILGAPYYNYCTSIMGRQTLFELLGPLDYKS